MKVFAAANKPRSAVSLSQAYVHYNYYRGEGIHKLIQVIFNGLNEFDYDRIKSFLILFQHMIEAADAGSVLYSSVIGKYLPVFFEKVIQNNAGYF